MSYVTNGQNVPTTFKPPMPGETVRDNALGAITNHGRLGSSPHEREATQMNDQAHALRTLMSNRGPRCQRRFNHA